MASAIGFVPAGVAPKGVLSPNDAFLQMQMQRRMALAKMLQQNGMDGSAYSSVNNMRVVPRLGAAPAISQIAQALLGTYEGNKAYKSQAELMQAQAERQQQAVDSAYGGGSDTAVGSGAVGSGVNPNLGLSKEAFADWYRQDPSAAMKFAGEHSALTDQNRQDVQQGRTLSDVGALNRAHEVVQGTQTFQPGTTSIVPGVSQPFVAADFTKGTQGGYDANGAPTMQGIQGNGVLAQLAGQQQNAVSSNTIGNVTSPSGASGPAFYGPVAAANTASLTGGQAPGFAGQVQVESGGNQNAVSPAGARGVSQLMPATAREYEKKMGFPAGSSDTDAGINGKIGQQYMSDLTSKYMKVAGGDEKVAGAMARMAYNAGPGKIDAWMSNGMNPDALPAETQNYNGKVADANNGLSPIPTAPQSGFIGQSTQDKALGEKRAGNIGEMEQDINDKAASAQTKLATNQKMMQLLPNVTTGPLADRITAGRNMLHSLGWTGPDPTNNQELEKYSMQAALENAKQVYGNRITNADLQSLPHWNPSATMTENAFRTVLDADNTRQSRMIQKQTAYNDFRNKNGDLNQFPSWFNQNYPEMGVSASTSTKPGEGAVIAPSAQSQAGNRLRWNAADGKLEPF
jgi:hypothetical protein